MSSGGRLHKQGEKEAPLLRRADYPRSGASSRAIGCRVVNLAAGE
jgi:hypothetical protein